MPVQLRYRLIRDDFRKNAVLNNNPTLNPNNRVTVISFAAPGGAWMLAVGSAEPQAIIQTEHSFLHGNIWYQEEPPL